LSRTNIMLLGPFLNHNHELANTFIHQRILTKQVGIGDGYIVQETDIKAEIVKYTLVQTNITSTR
jgi:hypothetical protein